jgi:hypothetical protein
MARAHVECIHESEVPWRPWTPPRGAPLEVKTLSWDPEGENHTSLVRLARGWRQDELVAHPAPEELFVIAGWLRLGDIDLKAYHYLRVPAGIRHGPAIAYEETLAIWIVEGPYGPVSGRDPEVGELVHVDAQELAWRPTWVPGPRPGLFIKLLYMDPVTGAYTRLIRAEPGWREDRLEHHDCAEEAYTLEGEMYLGNTGRTWGRGSYFWRPPGIRHGPMHTARGAVFFLRTDGPLVNHYTMPEDARLP